MRKGTRCLYVACLVTCLALVPGCTTPMQRGWAAWNQGDYATAVQQWQPQAEAGNAEAQYLLGIACEEGRGVAVDLVAAAGWYGKAAAQGHAPSQRNQELLRQRAPLPTTVPAPRAASDQVASAGDAQAVQWLRQAAESGSATACFALAGMCAAGRGMAADDHEMACWLQAAAELGHAQAQTALGLLFLDGRGVGRDDDAAAQWLQRAADQGNAVACYRLGLLHLTGTGVELDRAKAAQWLAFAAEQDFAPAQRQLGALYEHGSGRPADPTTALLWYRLAAAQGDAIALRSQTELEARLRADQVTMARSGAERWRQEHGTALPASPPR